MSQPKKLLCDAHVDKNATQYYGKLILSNIRHENGSEVTIKKFLGVKFKSPLSPAGIGIEPSPWFELIPDISTESLDASTVAVTARLELPTSRTFDPLTDKLDFDINGNLTDKPEVYEKSVELYADHLPSGTADIKCASAPDPALASLKQVVRLEQDGRASELQAVLGTTTPIKAFSGTYKAVADELATQEQTVVAIPIVSPAKVTVGTDEHTGVEVTYGTVNKYSALDVKIGDLQSPIDKEQVHIKVIDQDTQKPIADFFSPHNHTTKLLRLPTSGTAVVHAQITLNNTKYFAEKSEHLSNNILHVTLGRNEIKEQSVDVKGFVTLPIEVDGDLQSGKDLFVRIQSTENSNVVYTQKVPAKKGTQDFAVAVAPGHYKVQAPNLIDNGVVYATKVDTSLNVTQDGKSKLHLTTQRGAHLKVHGFPDFLSFGGLSDLGQTSAKDFTAAKASSLFKYAGNDGAGDPSEYLPDDPATTKTIELAKVVEKDIGGGHTVLPIMISYTCNLSLGDVSTQLQNAEHHAHSFANLILSLKLAKQHGNKACPCGYVINADFLGECQKHEFGPDYTMPVIKPLEEALKHWSVSANVPESITDTLHGYVHGVNWLIHTVAPNVPFGWQVNLWGVGRSDWVYLPKKGSTDTDPANKALETANYIRSLDLYTTGSAYPPNFLAVDRYEADDFTARSYPNGYCYGPAEWDRFYSFCTHLSFNLQVPIMPWQIPASRIPHLTDPVSDLSTEHWGTSGTYLFGDERIGSSVANINPTILDLKLNAQLTRGAKTVDEIFKRGEPWDLSAPKFGDFPLRGIFTVLLGGGSTTGIVETIGKTGKWTQEKVSKYMNAPMPLA